MKQLNVFPECYVDTNLVCYLLGADVKHKSSCNEVVKALNKSNGFAVGIMLMWDLLSIRNYLRLTETNI